MLWRGCVIFCFWIFLSFYNLDLRSYGQLMSLFVGMFNPSLLHFKVIHTISNFNCICTIKYNFLDEINYLNLLELCTFLRGPCKLFFVRKLHIKIFYFVQDIALIGQRYQSKAMTRFYKRLKVKF